jgi:hypothetical protein
VQTAVSERHEVIERERVAVGRLIPADPADGLLGEDVGAECAVVAAAADLVESAA